VLELLRNAVTDGRLEAAEFDERLEAALAARTVDALAPLTADLVAGPHARAALVLPSAAPVPVEPAAELFTIKEKHGAVRRDGRWALPRRLVLRTKWSKVLLDLTKAVPSGPELFVELKVRGGTVELVLAPGMVVDANGLAVRFTALEIDNDADEVAPETLQVHLVGKMKHGRVAARWQPPRQ
jgi:hypothetical protein